MQWNSHAFFVINVDNGVFSIPNSFVDDFILHGAGLNFSMGEKIKLLLKAALLLPQSLNFYCEMNKWENSPFFWQKRKKVVWPRF